MGTLDEAIAFWTYRNTGAVDWRLLPFILITADVIDKSWMFNFSLKFHS